MNKTKINLDELDKAILNILLKDARTSYQEIAKGLNVSTGTIHIRIEKMRKANLITGNVITIDPRKLGFDVCCFIGVILKSARDYQIVLDKLNQLTEVIEAYYTTGVYSIFIKVQTHNLEELHNLLVNKIQIIDEIQSTETIISMHNPITRNIVA